MRVIQLNNIAGVPVNLNRALTTIGVRSKVVVFRDERGYGFDENLDVDRFPRPYQPIYRFGKLMKTYLSYDIYHYHSSSFVTGYVDAPLLKLIGKKLVYHHHGSDIRGKGVPLLSKFANARYISTPDLFDWAPDAEWLPNPFFQQDFKKYIRPRKPGERLRVAHSSKGKREHRKSDFVQNVCLKLQKKGLVEWVPLEGLPRPEFLMEVSNCDLYVDNLGGGWYGMAALEAMSMKKPVCVYIREDLESFGNSKAYINANEKNFEHEIITLAEDASLRKRFAENGYAYVSRVHDALKIGRRVKKKYEEIA